MKMQIPNGPTELIAAETSNLGWYRGGSWSEKGNILFATFQTSPAHIGLYSVPATRGKAFPVEVPGLKEGHFYNPEFLPGGEDFLFVFTPSDSAEAQLFIATLSAGKVLDPRLLFTNDTALAFTSAGGGHILWVRNDNLYAQRIDVKARHLVGDPELVQEAVASNPASRNAYFSVSSTGTVVWRRGTALYPFLESAHGRCTHHPRALPSEVSSLYEEAAAKALGASGRSPPLPGTPFSGTNFRIGDQLDMTRCNYFPNIPQAICTDARFQVGELSELFQPLFATETTFL